MPIDLFMRRVVRASFDGQALTVGFDDGAQIAVETDPKYESWNLTGAGVPEVIAGPWYLPESGE